jgi:hypothetical protein
VVPFYADAMVFNNNDKVYCFGKNEANQERGVSANQKLFKISVCGNRSDTIKFNCQKVKTSGEFVRVSEFSQMLPNSHYFKNTNTWMFLDNGGRLHFFDASKNKVYSEDSPK